MRDAFAVLFFVSMGMLFDPAAVVPNLALTAATVALVLVVTPLVTVVATLALGGSAKTAVSVALGLGQIGEFSFILAALGRQHRLLPESATQSLVATSMLTITLSPLAFRLAPRLTRLLETHLRSPRDNIASRQTAPEPGYRAIVVGHGPVGRTLTQLLIENEIEPTVIELNHETVRELRARGIHAIHGDASQRAVLEDAGVASAGSLVFAASGSPDAVIRQARELNPAITILARTTYVGEVAMLKSAGAHTIVSAEAEVALAMAEHLLGSLGATAEQLDRERDRVRAELASSRG
jgi:CPA2 family monovalent cation:H+ antiporter-2